jgi:ubiquinone/menaquinone biosynthesis C-methylase UbiE
MADPIHNLPEIERHYGRGGLLDRLLAALTAAGKDIERLTIEDLAPVDEFHSRQRAATADLAKLLAPQSGERVIDIGSGLGGPSRYLARTFGCSVSGVDLTAEFVAVATELTRRTGLTDQVTFRHGSALELPFPDASFDRAWSQNVAMNIADRPRFYAEVRRVLKPGGRFALQDVTQGPGGDVLFPVPWSDTPTLSFLRRSAETRTLLEAAGFTVAVWHDVTAAARAELEAQRARAAGTGARPALGLHLVMGASFPDKLRNGQRNLLEGRTELINALLTRA